MKKNLVFFSKKKRERKNLDGRNNIYIHIVLIKLVELKCGNSKLKNLKN